MAFRNIIIESSAKLSVRNNQLIIDTDKEHSVAIEDISALLIESRQSTITTAALSQLGQNGCAVFFCDEKHLPCAVLEPYHQHSREPAVLKNQMNASEPLKKRLWQSIVKAKISNQAACLQLAGNAGDGEKLLSMVNLVKSGDVDNVEATAAQSYFPALFGSGFKRNYENGYNSGLNYGYAILRGCIARCLAVYGFLPAIGLHHKSALNAFNLADDLIEPFRPVVDLFVFRNIQPEDELTPQIKRALFNCLNLDILSGNQSHSVSYAIERTVQSLGRSFAENKADLLLPELLDLQQHKYE